MAHYWNQARHQRQEQVGGGGEGNRSSHVHNHSSMFDYEVAELTWENGQITMHGHGGLPPTVPTKPTWVRPGDTLESIVHQATSHKQNLNMMTQDDQTPMNLGFSCPSSTGKRAEAPGEAHRAHSFVDRRSRPESEQCGRNFRSNTQEELSACASGSATFCKDNDSTTMTWASFESPWSLKTKSTNEDLGSCGGSESRDEEREIKGEASHSNSTRRNRAAAVHNLSERRRRDRINQKMKALQKLVPNASKTDKASMLDEVIDYLKQLQAQVQILSTARNMPQMMMMQPQIQMALLAQMGIGMGMGGMGMLDMSATMARAAPQSLPSLLHPQAPIAGPSPVFLPPFISPPNMIPAHSQAQTTPNSATNSSVPPNDPYGTFLAQSMNMDLYNKIAAVYQQQVNQTTPPASSPWPTGHVQGG
ncbi:hypothetical protein NMG60_11004206 [Bertholletia excelsa]